MNPLTAFHHTMIGKTVRVTTTHKKTGDIRRVTGSLVSYSALERAAHGSVAHGNYAWFWIAGEPEDRVASNEFETCEIEVFE